MKAIATILALALLPSAALPQIQPGPNLSPQGKEEKVVRPMKLLLAMLVLVAAMSPARATNDDETKAVAIARTYKGCLARNSNKKTYTKDEVENYCGCFSVLIEERVTDDEYSAARE